MHLMNDRVRRLVFFCWMCASTWSSCWLLKAQTDSATVEKSVARMAWISSSHIAESNANLTIAPPRQICSYGQLEVQSPFAKLPPSDLPGNNTGSVSLKDEGLAVSYAVPTNQFFLEILPATNGQARLLMHGTTNEVYELMSKVSLTDPAWRPEQSLHRRTNENQIYTVVPVLDGTNVVFFWARDWTGVDENHNGVPDWWEWENFGTLNLDVNQDYDGHGKSIKQNFLTGIEPNKIRFRVSLDNFHVNKRIVHINFKITKGHPFSMATLVDNANYADAIWQPIKPGIDVDLGSAEGWHEVRVGLRGRAITSRQTWQWMRYFLHVTPPKLFVTSPTNSMSACRFLQIAGQSSVAVAEMTYDIANNTGLKTNQMVMVPGLNNALKDSIAGCAFNCVDVELARGTNLITLHATDEGGNQASKSLSYVFDPSLATNPIVELHWPVDGTRIGADRFCCRGWISTPTASIKALVVNAGGWTNKIFGVVERDGSFWVQNVPLHEGSNIVTLVARDESGPETTTHISLVKSELKITINKLTPADTSASGTISGSDYSLWVNGQKARIDENGKWHAADVPMIRSAAGTTVILQVRAIPNADHEGNGTVSGLGFHNQVSSDAIDNEATAIIENGTYVSSCYVHERTDYFAPEPDQAGIKLLTSDDELSWRNGFGGRRVITEWFVSAGITNVEVMEYRWPPSRWPEPLRSGICRTWSARAGQWLTNPVSVPPPFETNHWEHVDVDYVTADGRKHIRRIADCCAGLSTGGLAIPGRKSLFCLSAIDPYDMVDIDLPNPTREPIPPQEVHVGTHGHLGSDGKLWILLPDGLP